MDNFYFYQSSFQVIDLNFYLSIVCEYFIHHRPFKEIQGVFVCNLQRLDGNQGVLGLELYSGTFYFTILNVTEHKV